MKFLPYLLAASVVLMGTACSTADTTTGTTSTTDTTTGTGNTAGNTSTTTGSDATTGTMSDGSQSTSSAGTAGTTSASASATGTSAAGGNAADQTAFMDTFSSMPDPTFLLTAASSNMLEIQAGKLASQRATRPQIKQYGNMMVSHHTKASQELQGVATPMGVQMPTTLMPVHQAMVDQLMSRSGKDFDEAYMDMMETAHKMDIALFEAKSQNAENATVKALATKTLPMLRSHHSMADKLEKKAD